MGMKKIKKQGKNNNKDQNDADIFLKKHVGLIHCENKLTLIQRKICNILLFNALDKIHEHDTHEISLRQLCSLVGYNSNDSKLIKDSIKSLISVVMEWNLLEDNKFLNEKNYPEELITWNASSLLAGASIKNGIISYSYSPQMKSVLASLDIYGRINLFVQAKFNSTYSLVLYENCVRFKNIKQTSWFKISLFRALMGVSADKYPSFKEFKRNVINVAVKEINQKADICIEPEFKKAGRHIVAVQFKLADNENYQPTFKKSPYLIKTKTDKSATMLQQQASLVEILIAEFQLSAKQAHEITSAYLHEYIVKKMQLVKNKKNIEHLGAYLISALKNDYIMSQPLPVAASKESETSYHREAKEASEIVFLKNKYLSYKLNIFKKFVEAQDMDMQLEIQQKFEQGLKQNKEIFRRYKKQGLLSPFVITEYIAYLEEHFPNVINSYLSFDDFITAEE